MVSWFRANFGENLRIGIPLESKSNNKVMWLPAVTSMLVPFFCKAKLNTQAISDGSGCQADQDHCENNSSNFILTIPFPVFSNKQEEQR